MARTLTTRLHQPDGLKGIRLFEIFDRRFLRVRETNGQSPLRDYAMDIVILAPDARQSRSSEPRWLFAAAAALVALFAALGALRIELAGPLVLLPLAGLMLALTVVCITQFLSSRRHVLVFDSRYAGVPLVEILVNQPEKKSYTAFVSDLSANIESVVRNKELTPSDLRAGELRSLRKLAEQQVIDPVAYEDAKQRLLITPG